MRRAQELQVFGAHERIVVGYGIGCAAADGVGAVVADAKAPVGGEWRVYVYQIHRAAIVVEQRLHRNHVIALYEHAVRARAADGFERRLGRMRQNIGGVPLVGIVQLDGGHVIYDWEFRHY